MCVDNIPNCRVLRRWERLAGLGAKSASAKPRGSSKPLCWRGPQISMHSDADTLMYKTSCWSALPKVTQGQGCESRPSLETCTMKSEGKCRKERKEQKKKKNESFCLAGRLDAKSPSSSARHRPHPSRIEPCSKFKGSLAFAVICRKQVVGNSSAGTW